MVKKILAMIAVVAMAMATMGFAAAPKVTYKSIALQGDYEQLIVNAAFDVALTDTVKDIRVYAPETVQKHLTVEQADGTLRIAMRRDIRFKLKERPRVLVPARMSVNYIEVNGAASLQMGKIEREALDIYLTGSSSLRGRFEGKQISIEQAGASDLKVHAAVENISLNLSAASTAEVRGRALKKMELKMIEASSLDAEKFEVKRIEGTIDGASHAILWCTERMHVPVKNASQLVYIGRPVVVNCPTSDVSTVTHK
ncbi:MAG: DUF2807 domain-containing protein [Bacteroidales bacterium]|nr:DUF2807 domain-containing protein [Bacteroidales bacterium]